MNRATPQHTFNEQVVHQRRVLAALPPQFPRTGGHTEINSIEELRADIDGRIAVGEHINIDTDVVQQIIGIWPTQAIETKEVCPFRTADADIADRQRPFIGIDKAVHIDLGFQLNGHTGLAGNVSHCAVLQHHNVCHCGSRQPCDAQRKQCSFQAFHYYVPFIVVFTSCGPLPLTTPHHYFSDRYKTGTCIGHI